LGATGAQVGLSSTISGAIGAFFSQLGLGLGGTAAAAGGATLTFKPLYQVLLG